MSPAASHGAVVGTAPAGGPGASVRPGLRAVGPARSVYVHAPFCARRCFYCDFAVQVRREGDTEGWLAALSRELELLEATSSGGDGALLADALDTVFVGGGTPSLLGPGAMAGLARVLGPERLRAPHLEWTAEANPESLTPEVARGWREAGLNRLSLGVQSFQEPVLRWMGRLHGAEGAERAVRVAREAGIDNLSVDLIFGLPESLDRDWGADLERVLALEVPHVSLYGLTAETGTPLGRQVTEGRVRMPRDERYEAEYLEAHRVLTGAGYRHYEVSNFARPGFESRHNRVYWEGAAYLGLGNSAHSFLPPVRRWNLRSWDAYVEALKGGRLPEEEAEDVRGAAAVLERFWLGLRTDRGLELTGLTARDRTRIAEDWVPRGLARTVEGRVHLTARGWLLLDELVLQLDDQLDDGRRDEGPG